MDRGTERPTCPEEGRPESLSKNSWEEFYRYENKVKKPKCEVLVLRECCCLFGSNQL